MPKINPKLAVSINRTMVDFLIENYERYYLFAYSMVKNAEQTKRILEKTIYFSLYNSRKLKGLPPMKTWFYQLLVKDGMRKMHELDRYKRDFTYDSQIYAYMETLEPSAVNAFKLYYFEELSQSDVCEVLHMKPKEVEGRLRSVRRDLGIDAYLEDESADKMAELRRVYESPEIPEDLEDLIEEAVARERENFEKIMKRKNRDRWLKPLILAVCLAVWFFGTILIARENESFADMVREMPFMKTIFGAFI